MKTTGSGSPPTATSAGSPPVTVTLGQFTAWLTSAGVDISHPPIADMLARQSWPADTKRRFDAYFKEINNQLVSEAFSPLPSATMEQVAAFSSDPLPSHPDHSSAPPATNDGIFCGGWLPIRVSWPIRLIIWVLKIPWWILKALWITINAPQNRKYLIGITAALAGILLVLVVASFTPWHAAKSWIAQASSSVAEAPAPTAPLISSAKPEPSSPPASPSAAAAVEPSSAPSSAHAEAPAPSDIPAPVATLDPSALPPVASVPAPPPALAENPTPSVTAATAESPTPAPVPATVTASYTQSVVMLCTHDVWLENCTWPAGAPCAGVRVISDARNQLSRVVVGCRDGAKWSSEHKVDDYEYGRVKISLRSDKPLF